MQYAGNAGYAASLASYWTTQESSVQPKCIVIPTSKEDVSVSVFILSLGNKVFPGQCNFAVRSGGHTPFAGAANIQAGITLDLQRLNQITVASNRKSVDIGPGNRWGNVYSQLDAQGLATSGGRVAIVGAGGLITGGGISFFSPRQGYVVDNVESFEVVLATGQIVNANSKTNPDLWKALKGGSNNFGVVTKFTLRTFDQGPFWGGFQGYSIATIQSQFQAFSDLLGAKTYDPFAALIYSLSFDRISNTWSVAAQLSYTKPEPNPPFFRNFTSQPQTFSTSRISTLTDFTTELAGSNPAGRRQLFATGTYGNKVEMLDAIWRIGNETVQPIRGVPNLAWSLSYQPQPSIMNTKAAANGGNSLGLDASDGNIFNVLLTATWDNAADDAAVNKQGQLLFSKAEAKAKELGVSNPYLYLNYAAPWQDPISGYGAANKASLQAASKKYDPAQVFQKNVPGGFKLFK